MEWTIRRNGTVSSYVLSAAAISDRLLLTPSLPPTASSRNCRILVGGTSCSFPNHRYYSSPRSTLPLRFWYFLCSSHISYLARESRFPPRTFSRRPSQRSRSSQDQSRQRMGDSISHEGASCRRVGIAVEIAVREKLWETRRSNQPEFERSRIGRSRRGRWKDKCFHRCARYRWI